MVVLADAYLHSSTPPLSFSSSSSSSTSRLSIPQKLLKALESTNKVIGEYDHAGGKKEKKKRSASSICAIGWQRVVGFLKVKGEAQQIGTLLIRAHPCRGGKPPCKCPIRNQLTHIRQINLSVLR